MSGCDGAGASACFVPETVLPQRKAVIDKLPGQAQRQVAEAAFDGQSDKVETMVRGDRALGDLHGGAFGDLLSIAVAQCDTAMLKRFLALGIPADGPAGGPAPLMLALRAKTPDMAEALLNAGASANPRTADAPRPIDEAILLGSAGAVRLLLDHGADANHVGKLGARPLNIAVDSHRFAIAELLLERGADPWAADDSGGTLGAAVAKPSLSRDPADEKARLRLVDRVRKIGWPWPPPDWRAVKAMRAEGRWPPAR